MTRKMTKAQAEAAAKPCPFCGGPPDVGYYNGTSNVGCRKNILECAGADVFAPLDMWNRRAALSEGGHE